MLGDYGSVMRSVQSAGMLPKRPLLSSHFRLNKRDMYLGRGAGAGAGQRANACAWVRGALQATAQWLDRARFGGSAPSLKPAVQGIPR